MDNSIEIAVSFTREVGAFHQDNPTKVNASVFKRFWAGLMKAVSAIVSRI